MSTSSHSCQRPVLRRIIRRDVLGVFPQPDRNLLRTPHSVHVTPQVRCWKPSRVHHVPTAARVCRVRQHALPSVVVTAGMLCGHIQRDFRVEAVHDDDGFDTQITTRTRTQNRSSQRDAARLDKQRRQMEERRRWHGRTGQVFPGSAEHAALDDPDSALLTGPRATFAVLQCLQLVLRRQLESLQNWIPSECSKALEATTRNFWILHVTCCHAEAAPLNAAREALKRREEGHRPSPKPTVRRGRQRKEISNTKRTVSKLSLRSTLAILYLAMVHCRVPWTLGDLRKYVILN